MTRMFFPINRSSSLYRLRMYAFSLCNSALRFSAASARSIADSSAPFSSDVYSASQQLAHIHPLSS
ncbi:hypothetical protein AN232_15845 [Citrobacter sp. CRE-46]|nr:hypothetical protein AN232_15845 [Citrobacter sp. CRE-46]